MMRELIETLWNVNFVAKLKRPSLLGINRNIVECKFVIMRIHMSTLIELIETLWNVNNAKASATLNPLP